MVLWGIKFDLNKYCTEFTNILEAVSVCSPAARCFCEGTDSVFIKFCICTTHQYPPNTFHYLHYTPISAQHTSLSALHTNIRPTLFTICTTHQYPPNTLHYLHYTPISTQHISLSALHTNIRPTHFTFLFRLDTSRTSRQFEIKCYSSFPKHFVPPKIHTYSKI
jgi:hypothetical protein